MPLVDSWPTKTSWPQALPEHCAAAKLWVLEVTPQGRRSWG